MFPNYKRKFLFLKTEDGWKDLGKIRDKYEYDYEAKSGFKVTKAHVLCNTSLHIGKEDGNVFLFCPRCMIKTREQR
jgi:hypothetical protein